jgi:hypothetical protein
MNSLFRWSAAFYSALKRRFIGQLVQTFWNSKVPAFFLGAVATVVLKKWIEAHPIGASLAIGVFLLVLLSYHAWRLQKENRSASRAIEASAQVMRPDPAAELLAKSSNQSRAVVGNAIELFVKPDLTTLKPLDKIGWLPADVIFAIPRSGSRTFDHVLGAIGGINRELSPPNGVKFGLAQTSLVTHDCAERPEFDFYRTDYFTQQSAYRVLTKNASLRNRLGSLDPLTNQVPNATSLQSVVLFRNEDVLLMLRDERLDAEGGQWSISFEEQIKEEDFESPDVPPAEFLFRRSFVEEVFGSKSGSSQEVMRAWQTCRDLLIAYRLWGLFYEEAVAHFQLLGFYWLNVLPLELVKYHKQAKSEGWVGTDLEGKLFALSRDQQTSLLETGSAVARGLYDNRSESVQIGQLHRTSLYRLWRLAIAINRQAPRQVNDQSSALNLTRS